ncbi:MAG: AhpC/TSA family protein [Opitutae bacterium]|nr:AhpC/TSA family protein [Opitutae bacterium]
MTTRTLSALFASLALALALALAARAELAPSPEAAKPLPVGATVPSVAVHSADGAELDLAAEVAGKPTLIVFYRGSWCPYCNKHLAALQELEPQLLALGYQILALSPDESAGLQAMKEKNHLNYRLLSDHGMKASEAFGLAFRVDPATVEKYKGYGVALTPVPGEPAARWLPVPAAYVIGRDGKVKFVYANADYQARVSAEALLAAAKSAR